MIFLPSTLKGAFLLRMEPLGDERGWFARTMCRAEFEAHGLAGDFVQCSTSRTFARGTIRGLHYQRAPDAEAKLVRCVRGAIFDVIVDLRPEAPSFLAWQGIELRGDGRELVYVPAGFAHGYQTLEDDTEVLYSISAFHAPAAAAGIRYDDPALGIEWPLPVSQISPRDRAWPALPAGGGARPAAAS